MTLRGRITQLERRRGNGWTDCPDPSHEPPRPGAPWRASWASALAPFRPPQPHEGIPPEPACPRCGDPPTGVVVIARPWDADLETTDDDDTPGAA